MENLAWLIEKQAAEIERLQKANESFADLGKLYSEIKAEAIKEFAERLKEEAIPAEIGKYTYDIATTKLIDNLVKEMVGNEE